MTVFAATLLLAGCNRAVVDTGPRGNTNQQQDQQQSALGAETELVRQQIDLIPPPSKSRYMAIHSLTAWENPYLTVQGAMVTLHVTVADANSSDLGVGGILRPAGARHQNLNIRTADLSAALNSVPRTSWPYGRVVAIEEAHDVPASARPEVRRNLETAMQLLNDLGVVVYEWSESGNPAR